MKLLKKLITRKKPPNQEKPLPKRIKELHDQLVSNVNNIKKYKILKDYSGTYIENELKKGEMMVDPIFRVFEAAKPSRGRKLNIDLS